MKKLLILVLVLAMAPAASAVVAEFIAPAKAEPGEVITITFASDEQYIGAVLALITDNGFGGTATPGEWNWCFWTNDPGYNGEPYGFGSGDLILATGTIEMWWWRDLYSYTYTIPEDAEYYDWITFTVDDIPEYGYYSLITYRGTEVSITQYLKGMEFKVHIVPSDIVCAGDVDGNGFVNKADLNAMVAWLIENAGPPFWTVPSSDPNYEPAADVDCNGYVNKADITALVACLIEHTSPPFRTIRCSEHLEGCPCP